jgi:hypothetical protein
MDTAPGIAGSIRPELEAVFLDDVTGIAFFTGMSRLPTDVWEVDVRGLWIEIYEGWPIHRSPIAADRIHLIAEDVPPKSREWGTVQE